jgi:hypothetical protein
MFPVVRRRVLFGIGALAMTPAMRYKALICQAISRVSRPLSASTDNCAEIVRIGAVVVAELKLGNVERHIF